MSKKLLFFGMLLFFLCSFFVCGTETAGLCYAQNKTEIETPNFVFVANGKEICFNSKNVLEKMDLSDIQKQNLKQNRVGVLSQIENFGFSKVEAINYVYPEIKQMFIDLKEKFSKTSKPNDIQVVLNTCKIKFMQGESGFFVDEKKFYDDVYNALKTNKKQIKIHLKINEYKLENNLQENFVSKGEFSTKFQTSSQERKNNIKTALACFDGLVLEQGETLSFNKTTGERSEKNGYKQAKIIAGGSFVEGFGGGVCQVSTTIYNACLLAGLEVVEVHQHSLPVGYVEPSFDAMVNIGSSDLVVKNNTGGKIIFTTSSEKDVCRVKIYGQKNKHKITRVSRKIKEINHEPELIETDYTKFGMTDLQVGEERRISYAKNGYVSEGYLNFYDDNGTLLKTQKIRDNTYAPTKGIVVKREK